MSHSNRNQAKKKIQTAIEIAAQHDRDYSELLQIVTENFDITKANTNLILFQTDAQDLFQTYYLGTIPEPERQLHNCHACRSFFKTYGALATVDPSSGVLTSALWNYAGLAHDNAYKATMSALSHKISHSRIVAPFYSTRRIWGTPITGAWSHIAVVPPERLVYKERHLTATQASASMKERFKTVSMALSEFKPAALDELIRIFRADALARSEKFLAPAKWLRDLHDRPKGRLGENLLWLAIALAPEGFCHPKASVLGPLLDMITAGRSFAEIEAQFNTMTHGLRYQRPQVAPSAANIKQAEALVEKLGFATALARRFARLDECESLWRHSPTGAPVAAPSSGIFAHLKPKNSAEVPSVELPSATMTWEKFSRTLLASATKLELLTPNVGNYAALLTAADPSAPNIMKWDNPFSWYVYHGGSTATSWNLSPYNWSHVDAIVASPNQWGPAPRPELGNGIMLVLTGALDTREDSGNALFPETLVEELHPVRATIEAYSKSATVSGRDEASACGLIIGPKSANIRLRVTTPERGVQTIHIDRWD